MSLSRIDFYVRNFEFLRGLFLEHSCKSYFWSIVKSRAYIVIEVALADDLLRKAKTRYSVVLLSLSYMP
jgi:hypothetical protein